MFVKLKQQMSKFAEMAASSKNHFLFCKYCAKFKMGQQKHHLNLRTIKSRRPLMLRTLISESSRITAWSTVHLCIQVQMSTISTRTSWMYSRNRSNIVKWYSIANHISSLRMTKRPVL